MIFLDTSILVAILRGTPEGAAAKVGLADESLALASISAFELLYGARLSKKAAENMAVVRKLLEEYPVYDFTMDTAVVASFIQHDLVKKGKTIELNDVYIAATVIEHGGTLVTLNTAHFARIPRLKLHDFS